MVWPPIRRRPPQLIDKAKRSSLPELNEEVAKIKAASSDQEQRWRAVHAKRAFRRWTDRDGAFQAHVYGHPEDGAGLWRMLDPIRRRLNVVRRESGSPVETLDALDYDAVMTIASIAAGKDGELGLADLLELGLFPQLDATLLAGRPEGRGPSTARRRYRVIRPAAFDALRLRKAVAGPRSWPAARSGS